MPRSKVKTPTNDVEKMLSFKEGDIIFTTRYGRCTIEYIDAKNISNMPGASVRDENGKPHFVYAKDIIVED